MGQLEVINHLEPLMKQAATERRIGGDWADQIPRDRLALDCRARKTWRFGAAALRQFRRRPSACPVIAGGSGRLGHSFVVFLRQPNLDRPSASSPLPPPHAPQEPPLLDLSRMPHEMPQSEARKWGQPPTRPMTAPPEVGLLPALGSGSTECRWEPCIHATVACELLVGR